MTRAAEADERLPVTILTGFLGSGKTTLLNRLLQSGDFSDAAVIVNEFGEIAIDNDLIVQSTERVRVLAGGCVCCAMREDIEATLRSLFDDRDRGAIPAFSRVVIETTGMADPIPLLMTLRASPLCAERLGAPRVVTVVDVVLAEQTLASHVEASRQIVAADILVMSKLDLAPAGTAERMRAIVSRLNPFARFASAQELAWALQERDADVVVEEGTAPGYFGRIATATSDTAHDPVHGPAAVQAFAVVLDRPIDWGAFAIWLTCMLHRHGKSMLRVKGLIDVEGLSGPLVFHAAQHLISPPVHLEAWPGAEHCTRLVFIVAGLSIDAVRASLLAFVSLAGSETEQSDADRRRAAKPAGAGATIGGRPVRRPTAPSWMR